MANAGFELNLPGLNELMKSPEMQAALQEAGQAVANSAGPDYASSVHLANFTAIANVWPDSARAARENYDKDMIMKAAGSTGLSFEDS